MVAYNFSARFAPAVEDGTKRQTIRAPRKARRQRHGVDTWVGGHAAVGEPLQLYTGLRTKTCRLLRTATCHDVCEVLIDDSGHFWSFRPQELHDVSYVAKADGFASGHEMLTWFRDLYGLPFRGVMIRWLVPVVAVAQRRPSNTNGT